MRLDLAGVVASGVGIALATCLHPGFLALAVLIWVILLTEVSWARGRAGGRFLAQDPCFRQGTISIPERCPQCAARVP
jgi:hypothetical protein